MIELDDGTEISEAEHVAQIIENQADTQTIMATRGTSFRLPIYMIARLDAFAGVSGKTRNYIVERMLEVGMEETAKHLEDETLEKLHVLFQDNVRHMLDEEAK